MATSTARRPLPALAFLLALSLLTALVWWRVLHRSDSAKSSTTPTCSASATPSVTVLPAAASVTVTVLNSTDKTGLAAQVTGFLVTDGFKTGTPANDASSRAPVTGVAEIRYGPTGAAAAKLLTFYVAGATLVPDSRTDASVDLAVGAKYTAVASASDAAKALAAAKLSQLPPPPSSAAPSGATSTKPSSSAAAGSASPKASSSQATSTKASNTASATTNC
jgi:LytR cell envelope-related transcriptional attenuator